MAESTTAEYGEQIDDLPVGTKHESATLPDGRRIDEGDIAVHEDEIDERDLDDGIHSRAYVGRVEGVLDPERGGEPEVFVSAGVGRVAASELEVSGRASRVDPQTGLAKFVDQFLNSEYEDEMVIEWGDDIGPDGEDYRIRGE